MMGFGANRLGESDIGLHDKMANVKDYLYALRRIERLLKKRYYVDANDLFDTLLEDMNERGL